MAAVSLKAVVVGGITDVGLSILLGIPFSIYAAERHGLEGVQSENGATGIRAAIDASVGLSLLQFTIGAACSILGGYVAAAITKRDELLNGVLASWLCLGIGIYSVLGGVPAGTMWQYILSLVATPLCYLAGAYLWLRLNRPLLFAPNKSLESTRDE